MQQREHITGKFLVGVVLILISLVMGKAVLIPIIAFPTSDVWRIGCIVAYGLSWVIILVGLGLAGREGYPMAVSIYRDYRRRALGRVAEGGRRAAREAASALKKPVESGRRTVRRTAELVNRPIRAGKAARLKRKRNSAGRS